jgi:uncharacterized membrane protein HdeD (DUF308 family)
VIAELARNWWVIVLRGVIAILLGLAAFLWPGLTWLALVFVFGIYAIADGLLSVITGVRRSKNESRWWVFLLEGLVSIIVGVIAILQPGFTALVLLLLIAAWAIVTGVLEIVAAIRLRREISNEWWLVLGGIASVIFGILLVFQPAAGSLALIWILGAYEILFGIFFIFLGLRLRKWGEQSRTDRMVRPSM